jgi:hypothetical protein
MDPQQIRDQMKVTRQEIDRKLDKLQGRLARRKSRGRMMALAGGALASMVFFVWARRRTRQ